MGRFLIFFSYIGTGFSGLQSQGARPFKTVVSVFENALAQLKLCDNPDIITSSRTDKGVHALCNTVHTDLPVRNNGKDHDPVSITAMLNNVFHDFQEEIRVLKTLRVADNFHCRFQAVQRTYVYRICVAKDPHLNWAIPCPPVEFMRSYLVREPLKMDVVIDAAKILEGTHNYRAFTTPSSLVKQPWVNPVKNISISIDPGHGFLTEYMAENCLDYWNFVFKSHSFLYKQIRKMSSVLIAVGQGHMTLDQVREMVENSDAGHSPFSKTNIYDIPGYALYLTNVHYHEKDLLFDESKVTDEHKTDCLSELQQ